MVNLRTDWPKRHRFDLKGHRNDIDRQQEKASRLITCELANPSKLEFGVYVHDVRTLGWTFGAASVLDFDDNNLSDGWQHLNRSLQCNLASFRVAHAMGFPRSSWCDANQACLLLATAITLRARPVATWLAGLITDSYASGGPLREWDVGPFEPLMVRLAGGVQGGKPLRVEPPETLAEFYDGLLEAETADDAQQELRRLVVERVRLVSPSFSDYPPFEWSPFDLFPVDLLAILMVNHDGMPRFDFGPLESPLCDPPIPFPFEPDPLVERVLARVAEREELPGVGW